MTLSTFQKVFVLLFFLTLGVLYFGFDNKPKQSKLIEKSRQQTQEVLSPKDLEKEIIATLSSAERSVLDSLLAEGNTQEALKSLSGYWYRNRNYLLSGFYAEQVAELEQSDASWGIAGSTFYICMKETTSKKEVEYCKNHALENFDNAISMNPSNVDYEINKALIYVENPGEAGPMKGIQMLLRLNSEYPENTAVLRQLATLALRTNQLEKAKGRIENALQIDSNDQKTICLAAKIYASLRNSKLEKLYYNKCKQDFN